MIGGKQKNEAGKEGSVQAGRRGLVLDVGAGMVSLRK